MTSRFAPRPADEERFREFRARRLAKKEADREKLAAEFPLLFTNKAVGNKVTNASLALNKSATIVTPSKRKSALLGDNNENCSLAANRASFKATPSKTPLSSKKPRKGSLLMSPKPQQSHQLAGLSKTLPAIPTHRTQSSRSSTSTVTTTNSVPVATDNAQNEPASISAAVPTEAAAAEVLEVEVHVPQSEIKPDPSQEGVQLMELPRKGLFPDPELQELTSASARSSLSSLGESVVPGAAASAQQDEGTTPADSALAAEEAVAEQVQDALDYLLELDEVDAQTYRRVSSTRFSARDIKRLSLSMAMPLETPDHMQTEDATASHRSSTSVAMELAYPDSASAEEDVQGCVVGEVDVLTALRNYLATIAQQQKDAAAAHNALATESSIVDSKGEVTELAGKEAPSARSSTSSAGTFEGREEWGDAKQGNKHPNRRLSLSSNDGSGRGSLCSTMRVSFCNDGSNSRLSAVPPTDTADTDPSPASDATADATSTTSTVTATAPAAAAPRQRLPTQHPLADLLDDALLRGLVVPQITKRLDMGNHTKYVVETQILSVPGYPEENSKVRMAGLRRYSDFKALRAALVDALETKQRLSATGSRRSSLEGEGADALSLARSRRGSRADSVDPSDPYGRESLLLNGRDSLCGDRASVGGNRLSISELVPPLPSRQLMSISCGGAAEEVNFQAVREKCLRNWIEAVFSRQSCECAEYRHELRRFLTGN